MMEFRRSLPAYKEKDAILSAISQNQVFRVCSDLISVLMFVAGISGL